MLINNAGIARGDGTGKPSQTTVATLRAVYETNVFGVVAVTNAMLPLLLRAEAARIVNVSSEVGSIGSMTDPDSPLFPMASVPYPSSKTALNMITAMYAKELAAPRQGERGQSGLLRDRPQLPQRVPRARGGRRRQRSACHPARGRADREALGSPVDQLGRRG